MNKRCFSLSKVGLPARFDDISLLYRHTPTGSSDEELLELRLHMKNIRLKKSATLEEVKAVMRQNFPFMKQIEFFDIDMLRYHPESRLEYVSRTDFIIKINNSNDFMIVNELVDYKEIFQNEKEKEDWEIKDLIESVNRKGISSQILTEFVSCLMSDIQSLGRHEYRVEDLKQIIRAKINTDSIQFQKRKAFYDNIAHFLKERIQTQKNMEDLIVQKNEKRAMVSLRALSFVVMMQLGFTQYGSYIGYSWDIIEPMVCLFGCVDIFCAYAYWYFFKTNFDYQLVYEKNLQKLKESDINYKKIANNEYDKILKVVQQKRAFLSSDPLKIIDSFHLNYAQIHYGFANNEIEECDQSDEESAN